MAVDVAGGKVDWTQSKTAVGDTATVWSMVVMKSGQVSATVDVTWYVVVTVRVSVTLVRCGPCELCVHGYASVMVEVVRSLDVQDGQWSAYVVVCGKMVV